MDKNKLLQRLMVTFQEELHEHVHTLNQDLLALEKQTDDKERAERLKILFRTAHSLKGAARSVNVTLIEGACHRLEEVLAGARDGRMRLTPELFSLLFAVVDAIEEASMRLREQQDLAGAPLAAMLPQLDAAIRSDLGALPPVPQAQARSSPPHPAASGPAAAVVAPRQVPESPPAAVPDPRPAKASPTAPAAAGESLEVAAAASSVRVSAEKLDTLLARVGELLVARRRVESRASDLLVLREFVDQWKTEWQRVERMIGKFLERPNEDQGEPVLSNGGRGPARVLSQRAAGVLRQNGDRLRRLDKELDQLATLMIGDGRQLSQVAKPLDADVRRVRMLPFAEACQGLERTVRDLAQAGGKEIELVIEGGSVEMDRSILEGLKDPLLHLVRNAVDHGSETPDRRRAAGKRPQARITIAAALRGAQVEVTVQDEGRGLDLDALREQARKRKLPEPADERELTRLIFLPGLSTAPIITDVSGRGVGLDVVKSRVEGLHGTVEPTSVAGQGTRFTLNVPLTLTMLRAVLVTAAGRTFAFAGTNVLKFVRVSPEDLRPVAGREMLSLGGKPLPLATLSAVLEPGTQAPRPEGKVPVLIIAAGEKQMAFAVDEFLAEQEILVKSLGARIRHVRLVSGATLLPSGRIALVLNAASLVRAALGQAPGAALAPVAEGEAAIARKRVLVVDDSVTTRTLEKSILEAAGYDVATAADGKAAWQLLQEQGADLLVSDVDMPQMDGFALTETVRASKRFRDLPIVLVTARESESDKARGIEVGADAYLIKSAFDQRNLLETITQLL